MNRVQNKIKRTLGYTISCYQHSVKNMTIPPNDLDGSGHLDTAKGS